MSPQAARTDPRAQIEIVLRMLQGKSYKRESPIFKQTLEWVSYAGTLLKDATLYDRLVQATCTAFSIDKTEVYALVSGVVLPNGNGRGGPHGSDAALRQLLPKGGWFEWYDQFTAQTESPLSYHIFSSMCLLGAAMGRRVFMKMGFFEIFPNFCAVLIGPTGRVKKTSAANIAKGFVESLTLCPIMADAITPEALATALSRDGGHQLVYAPEFAVLFNRQKYNEALTTRIIRLLDCPRTWEVETVARGKEEIHDVALSFLGCSTPSLFTGATPDMVTSSGFLNRFLLVVEEDTDREFPVPEKGERRLEMKLEECLRWARKLEGEVKLKEDAFGVYKQWYHQRRQFIRTITDEIQAEAIERGSDHLLRTAMLVHIAQHRDAWVCQECMETATKFLGFIERNIPSMVSQIRKSQRDAEADRVWQLLAKAGGVLSHSDLLRKSRLDAGTFKRVITTLVESKQLTESKQGGMHLYIIQVAGGDNA